MKITIYSTGFKDDATVQELAVPDEFEATATESQMSYLLTNNIPFSGVNGYVEITLAQLDEDVPVAFPNSIKQTGTIEAPTTAQKTYREYTQSVTNATNAIVKVGYHDSFGNRSTPVDSAELQLWITEWGGANIMTPSEAKALYESDYGE